MTTTTFSATLTSNYSNATPGTYNLPVVQWPGGQGTFMVVGTITAAIIALQVLGPDGTTWLNVGVDTTKTSSGLGNFALAPCQLRLNLTITTSVSNIYSNISRVVY